MNYIKRNIMKRNIITLICIVTLSFMPNSCDNDLTEELKGSLSEATLTSETDAFALVDGCYSTLLGNGFEYYARDYNWLLDGSTDVMMGNAPETGRVQMKWNENEALGVWRSAFKLVGRANTAIDLIEKMDDEVFEDVDLKKRLLAEALFLRCLAYSDLTGLFGDVPLLLEPVKDAGLLPTRDPVATVYEQIEADLATAIADLPVTYDVEIGRATKGAVNNMLAKILLRQKKYAEAKTALDNIIASGVYDLYTEGSYGELWLESRRKDNEFIFMVMSQADDYNVASNHHIKWFSPWSYDLGWAHVGIPKEIYYAMRSNDARKDVIFDDLSNAYYQYVRDYGSAISFYGFAILGKYSGNNRDVTAPGNVWGTYGRSKLNVVKYRYADVLLLKADVENELGGGPNAAAYAAINEVRARAGIPDLTAGLTQVQFRDSVLIERAIELAGEGHRRDDLIRHDLYEVMMNAHLLATGQQNPTNVTQEYRLYPIPRAELDLNPNMTPNPVNVLAIY